MIEDGESVCRSSCGPPRKSEADLRVVGLTGDRLGETANVVARCFLADPNFVASSPGVGSSMDDGAERPDLPDPLSAVPLSGLIVLGVGPIRGF